MKAVILAAGKGERLKGVVEKTPKPMIIYKGRPILEYNLLLCKKYGVTELFINTHYLADVIKNYFGNGEKFGVKINYSFEEKLLGTAGALTNFKEYINEPFFVIYGDNISNFDLSSLKEKFDKTKGIGVIGFHYRKDVSHSGVAEFDNNDRILNFIEKPLPGQTESKWVNAGVYYLSNEILKYINETPLDFAKDIFPTLITQKIDLFGVKQKENVLAFDTPEMLKSSLEKEIK